MKTNICPICVVVSSSWLVLSAGVAWGYLVPQSVIVLIALLMGGTVVGIAYLGEKRCRWAAQHSQLWKVLIIGIGMPMAYLAVTHIAKFTVIIESIILLKIAYFFFIKQSVNTAGGSKSIREIEEKMEQCC